MQNGAVGPPLGEIRSDGVVVTPEGSVTCGWPYDDNLRCCIVLQWIMAVFLNPMSILRRCFELASRGDKRALPASVRVGGQSEWVVVWSADLLSFFFSLHLLTDKLFKYYLGSVKCHLIVITKCSCMLLLFFYVHIFLPHLSPIIYASSPSNAHSGLAIEKKKKKFTTVLGICERHENWWM